MRPYLSIIIPAYNEKDNFNLGVLDTVVLYLVDQPFAWEVLIVDDGSSDGSPRLLEAFCQRTPRFRLIKNPHRGKAGTVMTGVEQANGRYILFTDFDQATPIAEWEKLEPYLKKGYSVVIGSREVEGSKREKEPFYRHLMGRGFNWGVQLLAVRGVHDTQCGFKAFNTEAAKELFACLQVYQPRQIQTAFTGAFDVELLFLARKRGYKIAEVPIEWYHVKTDRVSPIRDSFWMALDVVKIRLYWLFGRYQSR